MYKHRSRPRRRSAPALGVQPKIQAAPPSHRPPQRFLRAPPRIVSGSLPAREIDAIIRCVRTPRGCASGGSLPPHATPAIARVRGRTGPAAARLVAALAAAPARSPRRAGARNFTRFRDGLSRASGGDFYFVAARRVAAERYSRFKRSRLSLTLRLVIDKAREK